MRGTRKLVVTAAALAVIEASAFAQTSLTGSQFALRSSGSVSSGNSWRLNNNGHVGTYIMLTQPGTVTFNIQAAGQPAGGIAPRMNLVLNDSITGWDVGAAPGTYSQSLALPAGTHFVRTELANSFAGSGRSLTVNQLAISGATVANASTSPNSLSAADTYIASYRKGVATVRLTGPGRAPLLPGTNVIVDMTRNAFNFGTAVAGFNGSTYLQNNPAPGSTAFNYQQALNANFNSVVAENAGKWGSNSSGNNPPAPGTAGNISYMNTIYNYAQARNMRIRMHNVIWDSQQPTWVNNMLANAGRDVDETSLLLRFTLAGDVNLSAAVDLNDFTALAAGFGLAGTWSTGDVDYDGAVTLTDFTALAANFGRSLDDVPVLAGRTAVPEPASLAEATVFAVASVRRIRRK